MLCLPREVTLMIDPRHIWNVIYNAQSNRTHPPTSPNTAPATQNDSHEWCPSHMKRHLQCAEQQVSSTNITKYCACHEKWLASLMLVTRETSFTMRGTTGITLQPHQMLCLPRKMTRIIDPRDIWNVIYNARSNRHHPPTSPNTAPATQDDSHDWCPSHMTRHLQCAEQQISSSNITKCCACHAKWLASSILVTYETLFTMRGGTGITSQPHQILRLPRKMTLMIDLRHIWNVIYNARSNRHHPPTSPNTAPATQKRTPKSKRNSPRTVEASIPMRGRFEHDPSMIRPWTRHLAPARSPRLLFALRRRILYWKLQHFALRLSTQISPNTAPATKTDTPRSPNTAPATQNDSHDWCPSHMTRHLQCAEQQISSSNITKCCACHAKWLASSILVTYETLFTTRGGTGITRQPHQILRLPRKMTLMIDLRHIWNVIYNARSNRHHPPTSPTTQKRTPKSKRNSPRTVEASIPMRGRFDHDPNMIRPWTRHLAPARSPRLLFALRRRIFYWKLQHFALRLSTQISPITAPATKTDIPRSPNTAPATQNDSHDWCPSHMTRHLQCAEQQISSSNITKCCACHAKWLASSILVTYETLFTMRGGTGITRHPHQILRLPRKMTLMIDLRHVWNVLYNARSNRHHPPTSPNTAPATQKRTPKSKRNSPRTVEASIPTRGRFDHDPNMIRPWTRHLAPARSPRLLFALRRRILYWKLQHFALRLTTQISPNTAPATKSDTPRSPNIAPATKNDSHDWYPWHMKRHLQCAEQQASPSNLTKCCPCHEKWCASLIVVTYYGTSFTMRGATGITLQPHQILRLPRKSALQNLSEILQERLKRQFQCAADSSMIRAWSDHELVISHPPVRRGYFSRFGDAFCIENYNISRSGYLLKFHRILRLPQKVTLQDHQMLRLPRKMILMIDIRDIWNVIYNARSNKHHPPTSPNAAPATKNDAHHWLSSHMARHLQCAEQQASPSNLTKYCACHAKVHSKI